MAKLASASSDYYHSFSAVDLILDDSILTFQSTMMGLDKELWLAAYSEELIRLIEQGRG